MALCSWIIRLISALIFSQKPTHLQERNEIIQFAGCPFKTRKYENMLGREIQLVISTVHCTHHIDNDNAAFTMCSLSFFILCVFFSSLLIGGLRLIACVANSKSICSCSFPLIHCVFNKSVIYDRKRSLSVQQHWPYQFILSYWNHRHVKSHLT